MNAVTPFSCDMAGLPQVDEALRLVTRSCTPIQKSEPAELAAADDRILAEDIHAQLTVPPCDRSAMDGYAFRFGAAGPLQMVGAAPAGTPFSGRVGPQACIAISTGGALPEGCDTVAMREHCDMTGDGVLVSAKHRGAHVRRRGEDFRTADRLVASGTRLRARHIALLAAAGVEQVPVRPALRIAILSVGDELLGVTADAVRDANRPMIAALCKAQGYALTDLGILPDCRMHIAQAMAAAAQRHDVIILSAGTSVGEGDQVRDALLDCGGHLTVSGVAIRPGKPVSFGRIGRTLVMALPGNPAAAYITFLAMGLPLLRYLSGETPRPEPWQRVRAGFGYRKKPGLREYLRVGLERGSDGGLRCAPARDNGPAMLRSLSQADGLVMLMEDQCGFAAGDDLLYAGFAELEA
jgi:molybdopterin molybdotransferase